MRSLHLGPVVVGMVFSGLLCSATAGGEAPGESGAQGTLSVSRETTYVTEHLTAAGLPDYVAAINAWRGEGVTPENNAMVPLLEASGPHLAGGDAYAAKLAVALEIDPLPPEGDYLVSLEAFLAKTLKQSPELTEEQRNAASKQLMDHAQHCVSQPWTAEEFPDIVKWLRSNEAPLAKVHEAAIRPRYFLPVIDQAAASDPSDERRQLLVQTLIGNGSLNREVSRILRTRIMLSLGEKRLDEAERDVLDLHRLARHVAHGWTIIEYLNASALEYAASAAALSFLNAEGMTANRAAGFRGKIEELGSLMTRDELSILVDRGERLMSLDAIVAMSTRRLKMEDLVGGEADAFIQKLLTGLWNSAIDWNTTLVLTNSSFDAQVAALRKPDNSERDKLFDALENANLERQAKVAEFKAPLKVMLADARERGEVYAYVFARLRESSMRQIDRVHQRNIARHRLTLLSLALIEHRISESEFPARLDLLTKKDLDELSIDPFTNESLKYSVSEDGQSMLLYSAGVDGLDSQGRTYGEETPDGSSADDIRAWGGHPPEWMNN
ncbi:hypothetical protein [Rubinisphaera margarita]|uniref:hypothetical protein n=1 Tax=Rubinisphaera margarita TaxID=2909586 RepID=UPI001EE8B1CC|nr:hypothetical protein [Rubinisphaera margarita]MCG6154943.1 hypothetical protein [Rubinisphaera margarita]